jgi:predicted phage-related endonuclease
MSDVRASALWSTESAAALGLSKYATPATIWMRKKGIDLPVEVTEEMQIGLAMQPVIAKLYQERTGTPLRDITGLALRVQFDILPLAAHFDYQAGEKKLVEVKNFAAVRRKDFGEAGSGDVPLDVLTQCLAQMAVYPEIEAVDNAVLFGGQHFEIFTIERNAAVIASLIEKLQAFWRLVQGDVPPAPLTPEEARALYPTEHGTAIEATDDIAKMVGHMVQTREGIAQLEEVENSYKAKIQGFMAENALLTYRGQTLATWKLDKGRKGYVVADQPPRRKFLVKG